MKHPPDYLDGDDLAGLMLEIAQWFSDHGAPFDAVRRLRCAAADIDALIDEVEELGFELDGLKDELADLETEVAPNGASTLPQDGRSEGGLGGSYPRKEGGRAMKSPEELAREQIELGNLAGREARKPYDRKVGEMLLEAYEQIDDEATFFFWVRSNFKLTRQQTQSLMAAGRKKGAGR